MGQGTPGHRIRTLIGRPRISTAEGDQALDHQLDASRAAGCERVFEDRASGAKAKAERQGLAACLDHLRTGDLLAVLDLDRPGRLAGAFVALVDGLKGRGVPGAQLADGQDRAPAPGLPAGSDGLLRWSATSSARRWGRGCARHGPGAERAIGPGVMTQG